MSGDLKAKLARMRGESPPLEMAEPQESSSARLAASLRRVLGRNRATRPEPELDREIESAGETTLGPPSDLDERENERGRYFERVTRFDVDYQHGSWKLDEAFHANANSFALLTGDAELESLDLSKAVFLDTETTGLSGGAGTYVFQVGLGRFEERGFELWQGFMAGPEDEPGLLEATSRRILESGGVVSFFGKSFDRHRLEDKMRLHEVDPPFAARPHLDLYHPLKRMFKGRYSDCRLKTLEHELSGLTRPDDLPGSLAPAAWFDFLQDRPHRLEGVFRHNADDVLSLVTLAAYLGRIESDARECGSELAGSALHRAAAISRALVDAKRETEAREWLARALALEPTFEESRELRFSRALSLKRSSESREASDELEALLSEPHDRWTVAASIEAAKLLEHKLGQRERALELCEVALPLCENFHFGAEYARLKRDLEHRIARLARQGGSEQQGTL